MIRIGIDPGLTGAIGVLSDTGRYLAVYDMPVSPYSDKGFVKNAVNVHVLARILREYADQDCRVWVEQVNAMPKQGGASMFSLGMSYYGACGVLAGCGMGYGLVHPRVWKHRAGLTAVKGDSLTLARELWPDAPLSLAKHHGRAEALLIARFGDHSLGEQAVAGGEQAVADGN